MKQLFPALILSACLLNAQADSQWTPEHSMKLQRLGEVVPSPDGKMAVWTQTRALMEADKSENLTHIFVFRPGRKTATQMTRGEKSCQDPTFSPDGKLLYFTSDRSGKKNIYRMPLDGGEAEMLSDWKGSMGAYHLSPDGKWIAFAAIEANPDEEKVKKEKRDVKVIDENPPNHSLWVAAADHGAKPKKLASGNYHTGDMRWSPDGKFIAFEHRPTPDFDQGRQADLSEVEVESGTVKAIASSTATESQPRYSPDGRYIAFAKSHDVPSVLHGSRVALLDRGKGTVRMLAETPDARPNLLDWAGDSSKIYVAEPRRTRTAVYSLPVDGPMAIAYNPSKGVARVGNDFSKDGRWAGAVMESPSEAPEAFLLELETQRSTQVSQANRTMPMPAVPASRVVEWQSKDGMKVEGVLTLPAGYEQGKRYPLALIIHGGPAGVFAESFIGSAGVQSVAAFAAKGYAVLRVNPRGSVGYGLKFTAANHKDWGGGDYQDIMTGVDRLIADGIADSNRMAVMGWSYGGYMTAWTISQTQRFKAAIIGAGITNLWSMWGTNDIPTVLDDYFAGTPWDQPELYRQRSGLFFAKQVKTPTLFLHGEADLRVPIGQAYEYYHALKRLGVTTKMVAYPRTPHGPQEPKFSLDVMQRHIDWVEKYVK